MENTSIDSQLFRRVMGCFVTGVTVVAARDPQGRPWGLTANAFTSLSLEPPLVLVCVDKRADCYPVLCAAEHFSINILSAEQEEISRRFATKGIDKFEGIRWRPGATGAPLLSGTIGYIECSRYSLLPGGDHVILIGRVEYIAASGGEPLVFFAGQYRWLQPQAS